MGYRSELEARLARKTTKAIVDYQMIEDGDRVMVGLSGGKDSWALLQLLDELRQRAPIRFTLVAVNVDSGYKEYKHELIASTCRTRGWELHIQHTDIGELIDDMLDEGATPCSLCARFRRGVLYRIATEAGATKIALGHHADDPAALLHRHRADALLRHDLRRLAAFGGSVEGDELAGEMALDARHRAQ